MIMMPMAASGQEAIGSMGTDTPLACLSDKPQLLYNYFRQLFAQVTNPPLDAIREELVTSLYTYLGREGNLLEETPKHCHLIKLKQPILSNADLEKLRQVAVGDLRAVTLPMLFRASEGEAGLAKAVDELCRAAATAVAEGASILVLSDRGVDAENVPIPSLLATSAVHHHLIRQGTRTQCGLVIETGEARESHHFCLLIGYGAGAVNPYLALETLADLHKDGLFPADVTYEAAKKNYIKACNKAILKVASKMGISTVQSYRAAQIFEAIGLDQRMVAKYFTNTPSRINGVAVETIARESLERHRHGFPPIRVERRGAGQRRQLPVASGRGVPHVEPRHGRQDAARRPRRQLRDVQGVHEAGQRRGPPPLHPPRPAELQEGGAPIPIEEVEPAKEIVKRFVTGAMSFGSISKEAHENLAIAMNAMGGKSNTGEGGEDPDRFTPDVDASGKPVMGPLGKQVWRRSAIKQVASARFGVTAEYLINAEELQIKMAQGAKPGEGGQLPGHKVDEYIGKIRHSTPGRGADLAAAAPRHLLDRGPRPAHPRSEERRTPRPRVSVKLVSEVGVGTVAAGVAKAKADHILISGDSGGTGASPLTSIKYAGIPWELGVAETQQTLVLNDLRGRVVAPDRRADQDRPRRRRRRPARRRGIRFQHRRR